MRLSGMLVLAVLSGAFLLPSCGGDDDDGAATGGKGGSAGKAGKGGYAGDKAGGGGKSGGAGKGAGGGAGKGSGGGAGKGSGGSAGRASVGGASGRGQAGDDSGGESGNGGVSGDAGGGNAGETNNAGAAGEAGNPDPQSTACSAFPETVTLGETILIETYGAVLCEATSPSACRLTTNTYSDGVNPCDNADSIATFVTSTLDNSLRLASTWHINSTTAGTINSSFDYTMSAIPSGSSVTAVIENPDGDTFSLVFEFGTGRTFTITSFSAIL